MRSWCTACRSALRISLLLCEVGLFVSTYGCSKNVRSCGPAVLDYTAPVALWKAAASLAALSLHFAVQSPAGTLAVPASGHADWQQTPHLVVLKRCTPADIAQAQC